MTTEESDVEHGEILRSPSAEHRRQLLLLSTVQEDEEPDASTNDAVVEEEQLHLQQDQDEFADVFLPGDSATFRGPQHLASQPMEEHSQTEYSESGHSFDHDLSQSHSETHNGDDTLDEEEGRRRVSFPIEEGQGPGDRRNMGGSHNRGMARMKSRRDIQEPSLRSSQGQHVQIRHTDTAGAMDEKARRRQRWKQSLASWLKSEGEDDEGEEGMKISMHGRLMVQPSRRVLKDRASSSANADSSIAEEDEEDEEEKKRAETQYRLTTVKKRRRTRRRNSVTIPGMYEDLTMGEVAECCWCPNMNSDRIMSSFLHWSFRSPFLVVFGTAAIGWLAMTFVFAFLILLLGWLQPNCIGGVELAQSRAPFMDAYQLSWTTFSTVGYGLIYPATSANNAQIHRCTPITVLMTFESFVGVLFSSLCAALMFAKVARVQSFAQVSFSDAIVIRYGTGVTSEGHDDDDDEDDDDDGLLTHPVGKNMKDPLGLRIPCPVLEFRIVNRLSSLQGGEIIDATLNMVAVIDVSQADRALMARNGRRKRGKKKRGPTKNRNNKPASHYQRNDFPMEPPLEEEPTLAQEEGIAWNPPTSSSPPLTLPKPGPAVRHRSVQQRGTPVSHRGPAPSLAPPSRAPKRQSAMRSTLTPRQMQEQQANSHHQRHRMDPRLAARRNAQGIGQGHAPERGRASSILAGSILGWGNRNRRQDSTGTGSVLYQQHLNHVSMRNTTNQTFEEDPSGKIIPKKILSKLDVESPDHPFFRRIWLVRHTLDSNSLLLKPHVRDMLQRNQGFWPKELNNHESIRASLEFDQILVSVSGTSNADANSVYAQHVYHMIDVNVGYRFVNALYRDPKDGSLRVDQDLINDVMEQAGGGGEPLNTDVQNRFQDIMVL